MNRKAQLAIWELLCVLWIAVAGSALHFAFELSEYWQPMAILAAVNESIWEHCKMYFWPGLLFSLVQYTYTRNIANNYWLGKAMALAATPVIIIGSYYSYMAYAMAASGKASLPAMLSIMVFGIASGQFISYKILSMPPLAINFRKPIVAGYSALIFFFASFTYFPPKLVIFENYYCYQYTGEYGILTDYEPYRVFTRSEDGVNKAGGGVNYCANLADAGTQISQG